MTIEHNYEVLARVIFNVAEGVDPLYYDDGDGIKKWRLEGIYSDITTAEQVWDHLAYNAIANGVHDASSLDGWGDLKRGQITMRVRYDTVERAW